MGFLNPFLEDRSTSSNMKGEDSESEDNDEDQDHDSSVNQDSSVNDEGSEQQNDQPTATTSAAGKEKEVDWE
ncbi:unnamed protein product [Merluccius merluccius]